MKNKRNGIVLSISTALILTQNIYADTVKQLEPVIVTAQKVEENIKDVPINITYFNEFDIKDQNIKKIKDLGALTPNLMFFSSFGGDSQLASSLRGIFSDLESRTVPVGIYIDGIPVLDGVAMNEILDDIVSIEVLKGPQGTLYGKNSESGIINITTNQPTNQAYQEIDLELGSDNKKQVILKVNGPLIKDKLLASFSYKHYEKDGFIKDQVTKNNFDDRKQDSAKLTLKSLLSDKLEISFINSYSKSDHGGKRVSYSNQTVNDISSDIDNFDKIQVINNALKIKYDLSDNSFLESITTRRDIKNDLSIDWDFTSNPNNPYKFHVKNDEKIELLSQELRHNTKLLDDKLNILFGLYLGKQEDKMYYSQDTAGGITDIKNNLDDKSLGLFTHFTYKLNDKMNLISGLRYDKETKKYKHQLKEIDTSNTYSEVSPKISLEYKSDENKMLYATIAKGYRAGGFNFLAPKGDENVSFDKETLYSYELGTKLSLLQNKLNINSSIYYMDISDMQVSSAVTPTQEYTTNAAKAHSLGFEIEVDYTITESFNSFISLGLNQTKFDQFSDANGDYKDNYNPFAPKYNFNIGGQYRASNGFFTRLDINGYGKMYFDKNNTNERKAYSLVNTKIGYESDNYDLYLYANNLFDKNYASKGYYNGFYTIYEEGREIGVKLVYRF